METLRELVAMGRDQGATVTAYAILLGFVAWIAGQGAKGAIRNVQSLLTMNEQLREQLAEQLHQANSGRNAAEQANAQLRSSLDIATLRMNELEGRLNFAESKARTMEAELSAALTENHRLRQTQTPSTH